MEEIIFPNQIRMYRRLSGKTMQELADHLGVSLSAISKIEKGYRRIDQEQLVRIAEFLDCPIQEIFVNESSSQPDVVQAWRREQERRTRVNERSGLKTLGAGLRHIRNRRNLTLAEVSEAANMTLSVYHRIEMGQREVTEDELEAVARALEMDSDSLASEIYDLNSSGMLEEHIQRSDSRVKSASGALSSYGDLSGMSAKNKRPDVTVPVYGHPGKEGVILVDHKSSTGDVVCPGKITESPGVYGLNLCTRRLGSLLPPRSVLVVDPSQLVGLGDIAIIYDSATEARVVSIREEANGQLVALRFNPDERTPIEEETLASLHRVAYIAIP